MSAGERRPRPTKQERADQDGVNAALEHIDAQPKRPKVKGSGGPKRPEIVVEMHIRRCVKMLVEGKYRSEIAAYFNRVFHKKPIPRSTLDRYMQEAQLRIESDFNDAQPLMRIATVHRLDKAAKFLKERDAFSQWMRAESLLLDVKGLRGPSTVIVNAPAASGPARVAAIDVSDLGEDLLDALERKAELVMLEPPKQLEGAPVELVGDATVEPGSGDGSRES